MPPDSLPALDSGSRRCNRGAAAAPRRLDCPSRARWNLDFGSPASAAAQPTSRGRRGRGWPCDAARRSARGLSAAAALDGPRPRPLMAEGRAAQGRPPGWGRGCTRARCSRRAAGPPRARKGAAAAVRSPWVSGDGCSFLGAASAAARRGQRLGQGARRWGGGELRRLSRRAAAPAFTCLGAAHEAAPLHGRKPHGPAGGESPGLHGEGHGVQACGRAGGGLTSQGGTSGRPGARVGAPSLCWGGRCVVLWWWPWFRLPFPARCPLPAGLLHPA